MRYLSSNLILLLACCLNSAIDPPEGWLKCNGEEVSRETYADLFNVIGIVYGEGNGNTTFNLPDLRGEFVRGYDDSRGIDANRTIGSYQKGSHIAGDNNDKSPHVSCADHLADTNCDPNYDNYDGLINYTSAQYSHNVDPKFWGVVRPRNIALLYCIKY